MIRSVAIGCVLLVGLALAADGPRAGIAVGARRAGVPSGAARADFDGDGRVDVVHVSHVGSDDNGRPFFLRVRLATGKTLVRSLASEPRIGEDSGPCLAFCFIEGVGDLNGDGRAELAVGIHTSAHGGSFVIFHLSHGRLVHLTVFTRDRPHINHAPGLKTTVAVFDDGAGLLYGEALVCRGRDVVDAAWDADSQARHLLVTEDTWRLRGDRLVLIGERQITRRSSPSTPPVSGESCF